MKPKFNKIGYVCTYVPIPLIYAANLTPYRILPKDNIPSSAGQILHDNLCSHVKNILDRAITNDLPNLHGIIFVNSCDAMRRLADAWKKIRPNDLTFTIELPPAIGKLEIEFLSSEYKRLWETLCVWNNSNNNISNINKSIIEYNNICNNLEKLKKFPKLENNLNNSRVTLQKTYNKICTSNAKSANAISLQTNNIKLKKHKLPIFLFGNVLNEIKIFRLLESCGVYICDDDLCTGSRMFRKITNYNNSPYMSLAYSILKYSPCARTFNPLKPGELAEHIRNKAKACNAKGVIGYILKFCDPYLLRIPLIQNELRKMSIPFLLLEGDCSTKTIGQQQTRIEAFVEMLGE